MNTTRQHLCTCYLSIQILRFLPAPTHGIEQHLGQCTDSQKNTCALPQYLFNYRAAIVDFNAKKWPEMAATTQSFSQACYMQFIYIALCCTRWCLQNLDCQAHMGQAEGQVRGKGRGGGACLKKQAMPWRALELEPACADCPWQL